MKWLRAHFGFKTHEEFAEALGISKDRYKNWESGRHRLSIDGALMLLDLYGVSLDFSVGGDPAALSASLRKAWNDRPTVNRDE